MPVGNRYGSIVAILDDPLNRAIVLRELTRRPELSIAVPYTHPSNSTGVFFDLDELLYGEPSIINAGPLAEVFEDASGYWAAVGVDETGPFSTKQEAVSQASGMLSRRGFTVLSEAPWSEDEEKAFPMP